MIRTYFIFLILLCAPLLGLADTSEFPIRIFAGEDLEPPTTPVLLSVVPVATTQIDVTWSASSDNIQLSGYVLLRDSVAIATTTLTTFFDTGLTASTTYSYEVYAFDHLGNISTTSNALATTTLAEPVAPPAATSTNNPSSATLVFQLVDFAVVTSPNSALFDWETSLPSRFTLRWGRSDAYDDGYIANDIYRREHQTVVTGLEPDTLYFFELVGYSPSGRAVVLETGEFRTAVPSSARGTPSNIFGLQAVVFGTDVELRYGLPVDVPRARVRILRSHLGFPTDAYDGAVVYEGVDTVFRDQNALSTYGGVYYTLFVIAVDGSLSSGAVVFVARPGSGVATDGEVQDQPGLPPALSPEELPPPKAEVELPSYDFNRANITLIQGDKTFSFVESEQKLSSNEGFRLRIPFEAVPDNLKSIVVTLLDPSNPARSYSFLLRINKDRTAYEATIAPLLSTGWSRIEVEIFDYERQVVARYQTLIEFEAEAQGLPEVIFPDKIVSHLTSFFSGAVPIALATLLLLLLLYWRGRRTEDKP